ncbi:unnamed protein product [Symbiodinium sp. CCMP2456]|nr:unnamed protein product [Symbiodinium sp. CCMP2456]
MEQQDAVEFTNFLFEGIGRSHGRWAARSFQDHQVQQHASGSAPITLPALDYLGNLQDAVQAWHAQARVPALIEEPELTFLQIDRHNGGIKNVEVVRFQDNIMMPVFESERVRRALFVGAMTIDEVSQAELCLFDTCMPSGIKARASNAEPPSDEQGRDAKAARTGAQGKGHNGGGGGYGRAKRGWQPSSTWGGGWGCNSQTEWKMEDCNDIESLKAYIAQLQRLILRHEDAINLALKPAMWPTSHCNSGAKEASPETLDKPLRATLIICVFLELRTRVANVQADQIDKLKELKWYDDSTTWCYLRWNAETKQLMRDEERPGLKTQDILAIVHDILRAASHQYAVARFHPTRPLAQEMRGEMITFLMQLGQHNDHAEKLCDCVGKLCGLSATQIIGMGLKHDRLQRSTLANQIASSYLGAQAEAVHNVRDQCIYGRVLTSLLAHWVDSSCLSLLNALIKCAAAIRMSEAGVSQADARRIGLFPEAAKAIDHGYVTWRQMQEWFEVLPECTMARGHTFTSITMARNVMAVAHKDVHNETFHWPWMGSGVFFTVRNSHRTPSADMRLLLGMGFYPRDYAYTSNMVQQHSSDEDQVLRWMALSFDSQS